MKLLPAREKGANTRGKAMESDGRAMEGDGRRWKAMKGDGRRGDRPTTLTYAVALALPAEIHRKEAEQRSARRVQGIGFGRRKVNVAGAVLLVSGDREQRKRREARGRGRACGGACHLYVAQRHFKSEGDAWEASGRCVGGEWEMRG